MVTAAIADLAAARTAPVVIVAAAGPGTLNHAALTLEALAARKAPEGADETLPHQYTADPEEAPAPAPAGVGLAAASD